VGQCESCLSTACATEKAACTADCYAIQACLDTVCTNLSATGSPDEGACQVYCQSQHPAGKQPHLDWVNCVASAASCSPPCAGPPYDYEQCAASETAGACKSKSDACVASMDCQTYKACVGACTSATACEACSAGASGMAGYTLYGDLQLCIDQTCLPLYWLMGP
jgi:hypothetical protein